MSEEIKEVPEETPEEVTEEVPEEVPEEAPEAEAEPEEEIEYVCPSEFDEKEELCKMFVGGLDKETTDEDFKELFAKYGEVKEAVVMKKGESKSERLFGFITFAKCDSLDDCLLERPHKYKEKELEVKRAIPKGQSDGTGHLKVKKLHIGNVPEKIDVDALLKYLKSRHPKKYGTIDEVDIVKEKDDKGNPTEKNRGFAFITVSNEDFADRIVIAESKFVLDGRSLWLSKAKPKGFEAGFQKFRGRGRGGRGGARGGRGGGWDNWSYGGYGGGYGYGYGNNYGYGGGYDYYGYPAYGGRGGGPARGRGRGRGFAPY